MSRESERKVILKPTKDKFLLQQDSLNRLIANFSPENMATRTLWSNIFKVLKVKQNYEP